MQDLSLSHIMTSNHNLLNMLNNLLEVHCYEVGQKSLSFTYFNLKDLIEEVLTELMPLAKEKKLDLKLNIEKEAIEKEVKDICADRLELRRVFTNLIGNAIKFTDAGYITIRLNLCSFAQNVRDKKQSSQSIKIEVEDTGVGISPQNQKKIFQRFRQGNHRRSGNGLGLHLCQQIIHSHHGKIEVQSELEKGTLFTIYLPL